MDWYKVVEELDAIKDDAMESLRVLNQNHSGLSWVKDSKDGYRMRYHVAGVMAKALRKGLHY